MLTLEQAKDNINAVLKEVRNPALNRDEHDLLRMSLNLLYEAAKDGEEAKKTTTGPSLADGEPIGTDTNGAT